MKQEEEGWHRRYLPHFDACGMYQMITYRLADSLPQTCYERLGSESDVRLRKRIEEQLDKSIGSCLLKYGEVAQLVIQAWQFWHGKRYDLLAYVVMPNHVHLLIRVYPKVSLSKILHSWKSWTSNEIHKLQQDADIGGEVFSPLWQRECWDRYIRDEKHFADAIHYIHMNPVKAGLVGNMEEWPWSSAKSYFEV